MKIGYRLCGSCNPHINTLKIICEIKAADRENSYVFWENGGYDALLLIGGCPRNCTARPEFSGPVFKVSGHTIDGEIYEESELSKVIIDRIKKTLCL